MGIYDRDYYQSERPGYNVSVRAPQTMVVTLIIINVGIYLIASFLSPMRAGAPILSHDWLALQADTLTKPWLYWKLLTYGFAHAQAPGHVIGNMLGLWFLGRDVEALYGRWEFLRIYLTMIVLGGVVWCLLATAQGLAPGNTVIGASGAVVGVVLLFALNFPHRTVLLFFVLPMPAWLLGVMIVMMDLFGATGAGTDPAVAYPVHLTGAAFALAYSKLGWNFGDLWRSIGGGGRKWRRLGRPKLRVRRPDDDPSDEDRATTDDHEVDRILGKISREGESSLTRRERKTLQEASRRYQQRRD